MRLLRRGYRCPFLLFCTLCARGFPLVYAVASTLPHETLSTLAYTHRATHVPHQGASLVFTGPCSHKFPDFVSAHRSARVPCTRVVAAEGASWLPSEPRMGAYKAVARRTSSPAQPSVTVQVKAKHASPRSDEALLLQSLPADALEASSVDAQHATHRLPSPA